MADRPVFGARVAGQGYVTRPSAYALIENDRKEFAVVETSEGVFLPGGGIEHGESAEQAIVREAREECGLIVRAGPKVAEAVQLASSRHENVHFEKPSTFLRAFVEGATAPAEAGHRLAWLPAAAASRMTHESHAWALRCAERDDLEDL